MTTENNTYPYPEDENYDTELVPDKMGFTGWTILLAALLFLFTATRAVLIYDDLKETTGRFIFRVSVLALTYGLSLEYYTHHVSNHSHAWFTALFLLSSFYLYGVIYFITDPIIDLIFLPRQTISEIEKNNRN